MSWGAVASVAASVITSDMNSDAATEAADVQAASADTATAEEKRQYDLTRSDTLKEYDQAREDNAQWLDTGKAANKRLAKLLGLDVSDSVSSKSTTGTKGSGDKRMFSGQAVTLEDFKKFYDQPVDRDWTSEELANIEDSFNALEAEPDTETTTTTTDTVADEEDGSLLRKFSKQDLLDDAVLGATAADADVNVLKRFDKADLEADPVYQSGLQFGLDEGTKGIDARATAFGAYDSGATLKALTRFANDYGSTKADESYARYNTDMANINSRRNESYNRYNTDNTNAYNKLAAVSGTGQVATDEIGTAGATKTSTLAKAGEDKTSAVTDLTTDAGNARASGIVGSANSYSGLGSSITGATNSYKTDKLLNKLVDKKAPSTSSSSYDDFDYNYDYTLKGKEGGLLVGPKHEEGGIALEAEGGEVLIPADVVKKKGLRFFQKLIGDNRAN